MSSSHVDVASVSAHDLSHPAAVGEQTSSRSATVLRFNRTERVYHWVQAIPFMLLQVTGGIILAQRVSEQTLLAEETLESVHKVAGVAMPALILLTFAFGDRKVLLANARTALTWGMDDLRWLVRFPIHNFIPSVHVPPAGKFNSGQKINLLAQMVLQPLFLVTGVAIWLVPAALLPWAAHVGLFALSVPLVMGHLHLALINPSTRRGLSGVFSGRVDAEWAAEHYPREYPRDEDRRP